MSKDLGEETIEETKADTESQRRVVRELMVLESRLARLRRELTKPIDYQHRNNQSGNVLEKELEWVESSFDSALKLTRSFIAAAKKKTGWAAYGNYKLRQYETDSAVRKADELFEAALVEYEQALRSVHVVAEHDPNPETPTDQVTTDNKEQA